jgi:alpha-tubulin suppressor-like RCC1 family protein
MFVLASVRSSIRLKGAVAMRSGWKSIVVACGIVLGSSMALSPLPAGAGTPSIAQFTISPTTLTLPGMTATAAGSASQSSAPPQYYLKCALNSTPALPSDGLVNCGGFSQSLVFPANKSSIDSLYSVKMCAWTVDIHNVAKAAKCKAITVIVKPGAGGALLKGVKQVAAGANETCVVLSDTSVGCAGDNSTEEIGNYPLSLNSPTPYAGGPWPVSGPGGTGKLMGITQVTVGDGHVCALSLSKQVWCWGNDDHGQIGDGGTLSPPCNQGNTSAACARYPVQVVGETSGGKGALGGVKQIAAGRYFTCALPTKDSSAMASQTQGRAARFHHPPRLRSEMLAEPRAVN